MSGQHPSSRARTLAPLREGALTGGAVAGVVCLVFALLGVTAGVRPLVFTSGSMAPTIRTGDLAVTRPVDVADLSPGDVVSVFDGRGERITHRVVEVGAGGLVLKGDANTVADPLPYRVATVDRVVFSVPAGGYVLTWLSGPAATLLLGAYLVFLLSVLWPRRPPPRDRGEPPAVPEGPSGRHRAGSAAGGLLLVVGLAVGGAPSPEPTAAAFTDSVPIGGTTLKAYTVPKPVITGCTRALATITVSWTAVSSPYALTYRATVVETEQNLQVNANGSSRSAQYNTLGQGTGGAIQNIRITAVLPAATTWVSAPANQEVRISTVGLIPSCGASS